MSKDAYYFSHDSNARNDIKMVKLRQMLGLEGYGLYWCVIEMLRESNKYELPIEDIPPICFELRIAQEKFEKLFDCELLFKGKKMFYSKSLKNRMLRLDEIKQKRKIAGAKGGKSKASAKQVLSNSKASKVKQSKEEESINTPTLDEFISYAKENELYRENLLYSIKAKYKSWLDAGWKDGNNQKIKNWKNKLNNVFPYLKETNITSHNVPIF